MRKVEVAVLRGLARVSRCRRGVGIIPYFFFVPRVGRVLVHGSCKTFRALAVVAEWCWRRKEAWIAKKDRLWA